MQHVKTVKRRIVQKTVEAIGKAEHVTLGDELEFKTAVANFKALEQELLSLREQLKEHVAAQERAAERTAALATSLSNFFSSDHADASASASLHAPAAEFAAAASKSADVVLRSTNRIVETWALKQITALLERFPALKKKLVQHANLETDLSSYTRRVRALAEKNKPANEPELAKLREKETRTREAYTKLHGELFAELKDMYAQRHNALRPFFVTLATAHSEYFRIVDDDLVRALRDVDRGDQQLVRDDIANLVKAGGPADPNAGQKQARGTGSLVRNTLHMIGIAGRARSGSTEKAKPPPPPGKAGAALAPTTGVGSPTNAAATSSFGSAGSSAYGSGKGFPPPAPPSSAASPLPPPVPSSATKAPPPVPGAVAFGSQPPPPPPPVPSVSSQTSVSAASSSMGNGNNGSFRGAPGSDGGEEGEEVECEVAVALFDYDGPDEGDLSFKEGETIYVQEKIDEGWWRGYNSKDEFGLFPSNYVTLQTA